MRKLTSFFHRCMKAMAMSAATGALCFASLAFQAAAIAADGDTLATVNGIEITEGFFRTTLENRYGQSVLSAIIGEVLVADAVRRQGIVITEEAVDAEVTKVRSRFATEDQFAQALATYSLTPEKLKNQLWFELALQRLGAPETPAEERLMAYFDKNKSKYEGQEEVNVRHILVRTEEEAKSILDSLKAGADFATLAKERSLDTGTKDKGGEVGFARRGLLVKEFEDVAFALSPGETSGIVKTQYGYHIIRLIEHRMPKKVTYGEVKAAVASDFLAEYAKEPQEVLDELWAKADIKVSADRYKFLENTPKPDE